MRAKLEVTLAFLFAVIIGAVVEKFTWVSHPWATLPATLLSLVIIYVVLHNFAELGKER